VLKRQTHVCIVAFSCVEVLNFCGPSEVFSVAAGRAGLTPFDVYMAAVQSGPLIALDITKCC